MATNNYTSPSGNTTTELFAAYTGTVGQAAATGFKDNLGADLNTLYEPLSAGSAASFPSGFKIASGADLDTVFAGSGTVSYLSITWTGSGVLVLDEDPGGVGDAFATFTNTGDCTAAASSGTAFSSLSWLSSVGAGNGTGYELKYALAAGSNPTSITGSLAAGSWHALSSDITFHNTANFSKTSTLTITIREVGDAGTETSKDLVLTANGI